MHGLKPEDIKNFTPLQGNFLTMVCVGEFQLDFNFHKAGCLSIEGMCELLDASQTVIDFWDRGIRSKEFLFLKFLGYEVSNVTIDTGISLLLSFGDLWSLRVIDNSVQYESFSFGGLYI